MLPSSLATRRNHNLLKPLNSFWVRLLEVERLEDWLGVPPEALFCTVASHFLHASYAGKTFGLAGVAEEPCDPVYFSPSFQRHSIVEISLNNFTVFHHVLCNFWRTFLRLL